MLFNIGFVHGKTKNPAKKPDTPYKIVILGDSLTAGYGLKLENSYPAKLQKKLDEAGYNAIVYNAGVSGDTTRGGLERADWAMNDFTQPGAPLKEGHVNPKAILVIALGGNDGLRGIDPTSTKENLKKIIEKAKQHPASPEIGMLGMLAPPNLGEDYAAKFNPIYPELADKEQVALFPFFLEGVITNKELTQDDGIHPNAKGVDVMVENTFPFFQYLIQK